jgi:hypothetical protein
MPSKAKKTEKLDSELKKLNREIGRRIQVEHVFGRMKCFKILSLYTTNFTEPLSYQGSAFLKLPKFP